MKEFSKITDSADGQTVSISYIAEESFFWYTIITSKLLQATSGGPCMISSENENENKRHKSFFKFNSLDITIDD